MIKEGSELARTEKLADALEAEVHRVSAAIAQALPNEAGAAKVSGQSDRQ